MNWCQDERFYFWSASLNHWCHLVVSVSLESSIKVHQRHKIASDFFVLELIIKASMLGKVMFISLLSFTTEHNVWIFNVDDM